MKKRIQYNLKLIKDFIDSDTPINVIYKYYASKIDSKKNIKLYRKNVLEFDEKIKKLHLSSNWFSQNIPFWLSVFEKLNIDKNIQLNCLEIGSWEGLSTFFLLDHFPNAKTTCVDTWAGSSEHYYENLYNFEEIESNFDFNTKKFNKRITKFKGNSYSYFEKNNKNQFFDFIYVDGSHYCDDVIVDAFKAFQLLKVGGILIFDDYIWDNGDKVKDRPIAPINSFLKLKRDYLQLIDVNSQITLKKIKTYTP